jgi:hypothetical protein
MSLVHNKELVRDFVIVASQGFPTLHLRLVIRTAFEIYARTFQQPLPVYGLWDFDIAGLTQVMSNVD